VNQAEVIQRLQTVFDDLFLQAPTLTPELTAKEVDEWDSLMQVSLMVAVEQAFGVRFRVGEVETTKNVGDFANLISRRMAER
jgi:acyl carrier protein